MTYFTIFCAVIANFNPLAAQENPRPPETQWQMPKKIELVLPVAVTPPTILPTETVKPELVRLKAVSSNQNLSNSDQK